jgi:hypothetical protein
MEEAIKSCQDLIEAKGVAETKEAIRHARTCIKEGMIYNSEMGKWLRP